MFPYDLTSEELEETLEAGKQVIESVEDYLEIGRGNQEYDWTDTEGLSCFMTLQSRKVMKKLKAFTDKEEDYHWRRVAWAAAKHKAAYCFGFAALSYTGLRHFPLEGKYAAICVSWSRDHTFAAICSQDRTRKSLDDDDVIVDPWPLLPQAVLWRHHFCRKDTVQVLRCRLMDKTGGLKDWEAEANQKYSKQLGYTPDVGYEKWRFKTSIGKPKPKKFWTQPFCSDLGEIHYNPYQPK